jgi:hypothetical protein
MQAESEKAEAKTNINENVNDRAKEYIPHLLWSEKFRKRFVLGKLSEMW